MIDEKKLIDAIETYAKDKTNIGYWYDRLWGMRMAIEIINQQPKIGEWILCSERLPEVPEDTDDKDCPEFNVMIKGASIATTLKYSPDGAWFDDLGQVYEVIVWMPLPEPWEGENDV